MVPPEMAAIPPSQTKVWQMWQGRHTFCCDGRIMVGPDINVTIFAAVLTTGVCVSFWIFVCPSLHPAVLVGGVALYAATIAFMTLTATIDPGIVPRNLHMDDAEAAANVSVQRSVDVNGVTVPLKWCHTCRIWRPPRASHCTECNVCVERFDHHCPWMGQCIGRRNYRFFIGFVTSVCLLCAYTAGFSLYVFVEVLMSLHARLQVDVLVKGFEHSPGSGTLVAFPCLILLCVGPLACYHCALISENKTTNEEIKSPYGGRNPFQRGCRRNCQEACCSALDSSRIHPRSLAEELGPWQSDGFTDGTSDALTGNGAISSEGFEHEDAVLVDSFPSGRDGHFPSHLPSHLPPAEGEQPNGTAPVQQA